MISYGFSEVDDGLVKEAAYFPKALAPTDFMEEILKNSCALGGVANFRVELQSVNWKRFMLCRSHRACFGGSQWNEILGVVINLVPMAHPNCDFCWNVLEDAIGRHGFANGFTEFPGGGALHIGAKGFAGELHAIADSKDRYTKFENFRVALWGAIFVNTCRPTAEDDSFGIKFLDALCCNIISNNLAENIKFPHPARDKLAILGAKIKD